MDLRLKNWNRRWFVLKNTELKYFKPNKKTLKGVINLETWCKLTRSPVSDAFELATHKKTYHLVCKSEQECSEWIEGKLYCEKLTNKFIITQDPQLFIPNMPYKTLKG